MDELDSLIVDFVCLRLRTPESKTITQHIRTLCQVDDIYNCVFSHTSNLFNKNFYLFKQYPFIKFENKGLTIMELEDIGDMDTLNSKIY